jgi:hypothetical protein
MVAMRGAQALGPIRILNQEETRAVAADGGRDGQPGLPCVLDLAIRKPRNSTECTPRTRAAWRCSSWRIVARRSGVMVRSPEPFSPFVAMQ